MRNSLLVVRSSPTADAPVERQIPPELPTWAQENKASPAANHPAACGRTLGERAALRLATQPVAQLPFDDLAVVVGRQGADEPVLLGPLEAGDVLATGPVEVVCARRGVAFGGHHESDDRLAPL